MTLSRGFVTSGVWKSYKFNLQRSPQDENLFFIEEAEVHLMLIYTRSLRFIISPFFLGAFVHGFYRKHAQIKGCILI